MAEAKLITRLEDLEHWRREWNALVEREHANLYLTFEWMTSLWESHYDRRDAIFLVLSQGEVLQGVVPLTDSTVRKFGFPFRQRGLVTNSYGRNHNDLALFGDRTVALRGLLDHMRSEPWDILIIGSLPEDSATNRLLSEGRAQGGYRIVCEPYAVSPYLTLEGDWETYLRGQSGNFRADLKRKWKRAQEAESEFRVYTKPEEVSAALDALHAIEERSWKEGTGTSITSQPRSQHFYELFLPRAAANGWLHFVVLLLEGTPAAYDMGVIYAGKYYMLKTSYDHRWREQSPGIVLRQYVMQELFRRGVKEHDFLGDDESWKMRWTNTVRRHQNLYLYNARRLPARLYAEARMRFGPRTEAGGTSE